MPENHSFRQIKKEGLWITFLTNKYFAIISNYDCKNNVDNVKY